MKKIVALFNRYDLVNLQKSVFEEEGASKRFLDIQSALQRHSCMRSEYYDKKTGLTYDLVSCRLLGGFGGGEHLGIGLTAELKDHDGQIRDLILLPNTDLRFGATIALGGDFYGVPGRPIVHGSTGQQDREQRFLAAFDTLWTDTPEQINRFIEILHKEHRLLDQAARDTGDTHAKYKELQLNLMAECNALKPGLDDLLADNSDHFSENAREAYLVGHRLAMQVAAEAGQNNDPNGLRKAYAMDGFACHFLTDLFASGHIRNQRGQLEEFLDRNLNRATKSLSKKLAGIVTFAQHETDGDEGLTITDSNTQEWKAFGDGHHFEQRNQANRGKAEAAVQASVNEIFESFSRRRAIQTRMQNFIPTTTITEGRPPLFFIQSENGVQKLTFNIKRIQGDYVLTALFDGDPDFTSKFYEIVADLLENKYIQNDYIIFGLQSAIPLRGVLSRYGENIVNQINRILPGFKATCITGPKALSRIAIKAMSAVFGGMTTSITTYLDIARQSDQRNIQVSLSQLSAKLSTIANQMNEMNLKLQAIIQALEKIHYLVANQHNIRACVEIFTLYTRFIETSQTNHGEHILVFLQKNEDEITTNLALINNSITVGPSGHEGSLFNADRYSQNPLLKLVNYRQILQNQWQGYSMLMMLASLRPDEERIFALNRELEGRISQQLVINNIDPRQVSAPASYIEDSVAIQNIQLEIAAI